MLADAARIRITSELRNEAIACMALADVRRVRHLATMHHDDDGFAADAPRNGTRWSTSMGISPCGGCPTGRCSSAFRGWVPPATRFSPDGRYLIAAHPVKSELVLVPLGHRRPRTPGR